MKCPTSGSEGFCVYPFLSVYRQPNGKVAPCCVSKLSEEKIDSDKLVDYINAEHIRDYRRDMMNDVLPEGCRVCLDQENSTGNSPRLNMNNTYKQYIDECKSMTDASTGYIDPDSFKMRYFDMRTSNLCNYKCRSCNQEYSSQWQAENDRTGYDSATDIRTVDITPNMPTNVIQDVIKHCEHIDTAYFAGGEPLIMDDHYALVEALAERNPDVRLRYNTNLSNLNYKNHDLLDLWSKFNNKVEVIASIDHYGPRAEYIRKGTVWDKQLENLHKVANFDNVTFAVSAVVTVYNFVSLDTFIRYLHQEGIIKPGEPDPDNSEIIIDTILGLYPTADPSWLSARALPEHLKQEGTERIQYIKQQLEQWGYRKHGVDGSQIAMLDTVLDFVNAEHTWEDNKENFIYDNGRLDTVRNEDFIETFPELSSMVL